MRPATLARRLTAEFIGTALLLAAIVGFGIMGDRHAGGNVAVALLANTLATGAALVALILTFGPVSGAHFNPAVSIADATQGGLSAADAAAYCVDRDARRISNDPHQRARAKPPLQNRSKRPIRAPSVAPWLLLLSD